MDEKKEDIQNILNEEFLDENDEAAFRKIIPQGKNLFLYTSDGDSISLENFYRGSHCFLICSGPSLNNLDLSLLNKRGIVTMAVNNAWSVFKPNLWTCVDDPGNFLDIGWKDPSILKFAPLSHVHKQLQVKEDNGLFRPSQFKVKEMPSVLYYRRNEKFELQNFLCQNTVNWGNKDKEMDELGNKGGRSVMMAAIRILYYLGFRRVYLLGADFNMQTGKDNYAFKQDRSLSSVNGNNNTYKTLDSRFKALKPIFDSFNYKIYNCNSDSGLKAFPYMSYEEAINRSSGKFQKTIDTIGWYERKEKEKEAAEHAKKAIEQADKLDLGEEVEEILE